MTENEIGNIIIDCVFSLHKELGPGLLETVYETILAQMLVDSGLTVGRQVPIPIEFRGVKFVEGFRADLVVNGRLFWS